MNKGQAGGKLDQLKGEIQKAWGKLTSDEVELYKGNATKFYRTLKEKYGITREEAEKRIKDLAKSSKGRAA